ncbi:Non-histone chromosomal protein 6 [Saitozyma sp. JCM 24511]|nr:Non-histone chromosomal protein 6 [Saitozyma sp. JCM 24511]
MPRVSTKEDKKSSSKATAAGKAKKVKDPNKPKRALSAYMFFVQDYRERLKSENPDATFGEVGKLLGAKWKEMSAGEKKPYEDQAEKDKKRAAKEKGEYDSANGKKPKKSAKAVVEEDDDEDESDD